MEYAAITFTVSSVILGFAGLLSARTSIHNWIRLSRVSSGNLLDDDFGPNLAREQFNKQGYRHFIREMKKRLNRRFGSNGFNVIATPAEVDHVFAFLLSQFLNKRFCSIHTSSDWPSQITAYRYNSIQKGDRVILVAVVLSSGKFMLPAIDAVLAAGGTVCGVITIIEALPEWEKSDPIEKILLQRNVYFDAIHRSFSNHAVTNRIHSPVNAQYAHSGQRHESLVMHWQGEQVNQLHCALLSAFPDVPSLSRMVKMEMGQNIVTIASGTNLAEIAFSLIGWAEAQGLAQELVEAATRANSTNPELRRFVDQYLRSP
jgi:adenine/guanine phosphoribosyltransferase-like PRPP-binding protein